MKVAELRELTIVELKNKLKTALEEKFKLKMQLVTGNGKLAPYQAARTFIAQLHTVITEKTAKKG